MLGRGHAEALVPMIERLPGKGHAARIAVGLGPGSFTGVRIGLAAAQALALAWGSQVIGYPTLALIAAMAREQRSTPVLVATTGGHGEWFVQSFDQAGTPVTALASLSPEDAMAQANGGAKGVIVAGSQAEALVTRRAALGLPAGEAMALWPDARRLMALSASAFVADLSPLYGRAPDARLPGAR